MTEIYIKKNGVLERQELGFSVLPVRAVGIDDDGQLFLELAQGSDMVFSISDEGFLEVEYV